ncbi:hypothetical protein OF83DRAFT_1088274 [Amylostereum chailletii]|nr:hypothetical protein OF83DRAFT_1088274 [Amylostereum chailletii]
MPLPSTSLPLLSVLPLSSDLVWCDCRSHCRVRDDGQWISGQLRKAHRLEDGLVRTAQAAEAEIRRLRISGELQSRSGTGDSPNVSGVLGQLLALENEIITRMS